jgi:Domain of unknown function (DUF4926)
MRVGDSKRRLASFAGPNGRELAVTAVWFRQHADGRGAVRDFKASAGETTMKLPLYERVALTQDLEEHGLRKGDVGVLVDYVPCPKGAEEGCLLEVFNALGESIAVVAVRLSGIEPVRADEVLAVRQLAKAG